jgi:hypothetical protein
VQGARVEPELAIRRHRFASLERVRGLRDIPVAGGMITR